MGDAMALAVIDHGHDGGGGAIERERDLHVDDGLGYAPLQLLRQTTWRLRRGALDMHVFGDLGEVRDQVEQWLADYNTYIPHDSLGDLTTAEFCSTTN